VNRDIKSLILGAISVSGLPLVVIRWPSERWWAGLFSTLLTRLGMFLPFCSIPSLYFASRPWKRNWTRRRLIRFILGVLGAICLGYVMAFWVWFIFFAPPD
jgi:hypothetical protein